jgi:hypothetical protein
MAAAGLACQSPVLRADESGDDCGRYPYEHSELLPGTGFRALTIFFNMAAANFHFEV